MTRLPQTQLSRASQLMTTGGDARIVLDPATGLNRYHSAPAPRDIIAYASSTANDLSADAHAHVVAWLAENVPHGDLHPADYAAALEALRGRIRAAYDLPEGCDIAFAPSGTDLEYVAVAAVGRRAPGGVHNFLLGADEVGSGCIHSAHGRYFARETALAIPTVPGEPVAGLGTVTLSEFPVRNESGTAYGGAVVADEMRAAIARAIADGTHPLIHIVHGSKTGLILPSMEEVGSLQKAFGDSVTFVVDACQARITSAAVKAYLDRGIIVFLTGSKFMGGPPFSGFALLPAGVADHAQTLADGMLSIFRRGEWPQSWPGREDLVDSANLGLLLRLEASIFELERFQALPIDRVRRVIDAFSMATTALQAQVGARTVTAYPPGGSGAADIHPIEMRTLVTLDLSQCPGNPSFDDAVRMQKALLERGIRLGQPVRCVRHTSPTGEEGWAGTLRVGLSMPQVIRFDRLDDDALHDALAADMSAIGKALLAVMESAPGVA